MDRRTGSSMAWSNNAENVYSFRINRVEPLNIPLLSKVTGPLRYDFFVGSLKGHNVPQSPWVHAEMFSFRPTNNFEFGFERTIIWGGEGHAPVTLHTFLKSFFSIYRYAAGSRKSRANDQAHGIATSISPTGCRLFGVTRRFTWIRSPMTM